MGKLYKTILTFGITLFALVVLTGANGVSASPIISPTPTPTCSPTPTPTDTPTPTPTPCQGNLCIVIDCDGGGTCEVNTGSTPTPTPTQVVDTPTPTQAQTSSSNGGDGLSDGRSSSSAPSQAVLGIMAPTGNFIYNVMDFMLLSGVVILSIAGYLAYGKKKKA